MKNLFLYIILIIAASRGYATSKTMVFDFRIEDDSTNMSIWGEKEQQYLFTHVVPDMIDLALSNNSGLRQSLSHPQSAYDSKSPERADSDVITYQGNRMGARYSWAGYWNISGNAIILHSLITDNVLALSLDFVDEFPTSFIQDISIESLQDFLIKIPERFKLLTGEESPPFPIDDINGHTHNGLLLNAEALAALWRNDAEGALSLAQEAHTFLPDYQPIKRLLPPSPSYTAGTLTELASLVPEVNPDLVTDNIKNQRSGMDVFLSISASTVLFAGIGMLTAYLVEESSPTTEKIAIYAAGGAATGLVLSTSVLLIRNPINSRIARKKTIYYYDHETGDLVNVIAAQKILEKLDSNDTSVYADLLKDTSIIPSNTDNSYTVKCESYMFFEPKFFDISFFDGAWVLTDQ